VSPICAHLCPREIRDGAAFFEPDQHPAGVEFVLVNDAFVVDGGGLTGARPGAVLNKREAAGWGRPAASSFRRNTTMVLIDRVSGSNL